MTTLVEPVKFVKPNITPDDIRPPLHITPLPEPDEVTDIEIYRYTTVCEGWICVHVFVWFNCSHSIEFSPRRTQDAFDWVEQNYPGRKVRVNV